MLHQRQKDKSLLLTSSAAIFSKNFFSNEKIGKRSNSTDSKTNSTLFFM